MGILMKKWQPGSPDRRNVIVNTGDGNGGGGIKAFGGVVAIVALITGIAAIVKPMEQEINYLKIEIANVESRQNNENQKMDDKIQVEIAKLDGKINLEIERCRARLEKLERIALNYQEKTLGDIAVLHEETQTLEQEMSDLKISEISLLKERITELSRKIEDLQIKRGP